MSKALELIRTLIDGANEYEKETGNKNPTVYLSRNNLLVIEKSLQRLEAIDNANPSEALEEIKTLRGFNQVELNNDENVNKSLDIIEQALLKKQELANENELLKAFIADYEKGDTPLKSALFREKKENELLEATIEDLRRDIALLKAQEQKHYLKWEDLEFKKEEQTMKVMLNGERYLVKYVNEWFCGWCNKVQITNGTYILCTLGNGMKQFFNDLHLERVEE